MGSLFKKRNRALILKLMLLSLKNLSLGETEEESLWYMLIDLYIKGIIYLVNWIIGLNLE
jgi:hypothetical protein